jgi:hypothetical protein
MRCSTDSAPVQDAGQSLGRGVLRAESCTSQLVDPAEGLCTSTYYVVLVVHVPEHGSNFMVSIKLLELLALLDQSCFCLEAALSFKQAAWKSSGILLQRCRHAHPQARRSPNPATGVSLNI